MLTMDAETYSRWLTMTQRRLAVASGGGVEFRSSKSVAQPPAERRAKLESPRPYTTALRALGVEMQTDGDVELIDGLPKPWTHALRRLAASEATANAADAHEVRDSSGRVLPYSTAIARLRATADR